jgi:16S rRNA processing protein RimM
MGQNHSTKSKLIKLGVIGAPFGINGWVTINSYTEPKDNIINLNNWSVIDDFSDPKTQCELKIVATKKFNNKIIALFAGVSDRNQAALFTNKTIVATINSLPKLDKNQYYWEELIGFKVYNLSGEKLGIVDHIFATKANDILVIKNEINSKEYLIPYSFNNIINHINQEEQTITVTWELD